MTIRRKQIVLISLLAMLGLLAYSLAQTDDTSERGWFHQGVMWAATPVQQVFLGTINGVLDTWDAYVALVNTKEESKILWKENRLLKRRLADQEPILAENTRLRNLLVFKERHPHRYLPASVIAADILGQYRTVTLNAGHTDGVRKSMPVVNADGVVGRIIEVYSSFSRVLLMTDINSSIDGQVRRTGARGMIQGTNEAEDMHCKFAFSLRTEDVQEKDAIETSGLDQQFPPGLLLGHVSKVTKTDYGIFQDAVVKPVVDFTTIREVLILTGRMEAP